MEMEKYMEILIYNTVGGVTGLLSQREQERSVQLFLLRYLVVPRQKAIFGSSFLRVNYAI